MKRIIGLGIILIVIGIGLITTMNVSKKEPLSSMTNSEVQTPNSIYITGYAFHPQNMTVKKGTTVTWKNEDIAKHNIAFDAGSPDESVGPLFGKGEMYSFTFTKTGTYHYHCEPHPYMKGVVTVQ